MNVPDDYVTSITLWDLPGTEDLDMRETYYRNVDAVIGKLYMSMYRVMFGRRLRLTYFER